MGGRLIDVVLDGRPSDAHVQPLRPAHGACRFGDGGCHLRNADVLMFCVHISLPDESSPLRTEDTRITFPTTRL